MEVTLNDILNARERRVQHQRRLLEIHRKPLICFTMNIAGPQKVTPLISQGFEFGKTLLTAQLTGIPLVHFEDCSADTGCELFVVANAAPEVLKALTAEIEDSMPIGRLFDMDVLTAEGRKLSRQEFGLPQRKCLLCDKPAYLCSRSRAHSVAQLQEKTNQLLQEALHERVAKHIASTAQKALLYEVCATPKPGLVDRQNSGSHRDMDIFSFLSSAAALGPYFEDCAKIGMHTPDPREAFRKLRFRGRLADQEMLSATNGINTHKGAIFSLGLLCAAAGYLPESQHSGEALLSRCAVLVEGITARDFSGLTEENAATNGQKLFLRHGITGIRGEAEAGFPTVLNIGLPVLQEGIRQGYSLNDASCAALLAILSAADDTNLISRSSIETQQTVKKQLRQLLQGTPFPHRDLLEQLDNAFISENLSPGGSADLLSVTLFVHFLSEK